MISVRLADPRLERNDGLRVAKAGHSAMAIKWFQSTCFKEYAQAIAFAAARVSSWESG